MVKIIAVLLLSGGLLAGSAFAQSAGFIGNTIVAETPGLGSMSFAVAEDGTFTGADGSSGTWTLEGDQLCFIVEGQDDLCGVFDVTKQAGDSWEEVSWDGNGMAQISITAGLGN